MEYFELFCLDLLPDGQEDKMKVETQRYEQVKNQSLGSFALGRMYKVMIIIEIFYSPEIFKSGNFMFS